jgi:hypothetical protein
MKKLLIPICLMLFGALFNSAFCQDTKISISVEGGPGITNFYRTKDGDKHNKPILGGYTGVLVQYHLTPHFSLRSGFTYERTGTNFWVENYDMQADLIYHFDYVTIPVLVRAEYGKKIRFYANIGPYFSYLVSQQYLVKEGKKYRDFTSDLAYDNSVNKCKLDIGIAGGLGIVILVKNNAAITLGVTDYLGLVDTKKQPDFYNEMGQNLGFSTATYNNSAFFVVGFSVMIGKTK